MSTPHSPTGPGHPDPVLAELADATGLGPHEASFRAGPQAFDFKRLVIGAFVLFGLHFATTHGMDDPAPKGEPLALGVLATALGLWTIMAPLVATRRHLHLFENGFIHVNGERHEAFHLDRLQAFQQKATEHYVNGGYQGTSHDITVRRADGLKLTLTNRYSDIGEFARAVAAKYSARRLPRLIEACHCGEDVPFGPLTINLQGLRKGRKTLPWDQVERVVLHKGRLKIHRTGAFMAWADVSSDAVAGITDFNALLQLCCGQQIDSTTEPIALPTPPNRHPHAIPDAPPHDGDPLPRIPAPEHLASCTGDEHTCPDTAGHHTAHQQALQALDEAHRLPAFHGIHHAGWATDTLRRLGHHEEEQQASRLARQHLHTLAGTPVLPPGIKRSTLITARQVAVSLSESRRPIAEQITHARAWADLAARLGHDPAPAPATTWLNRLIAWRNGDTDPTGTLT
ncbi:DUF6585 family protein [Kitasatospora sp. NPDC004240]